MSQQRERLDLASFFHGQAFAKLEAEVQDLKEWRALVESYADGIRTYLKRGAIVLLVWLLGLITTALPGSPLGFVAEWLGHVLLSV